MSEPKRTLVETEPGQAIGLPGGRLIATRVLPTLAAMASPSPFAQIVRAVASEDFATLYFLQRPVDERDDLIRRVQEAVNSAGPGTEPVVLDRRVDPVASVLLPMAVLKDLRDVIDQVIAAVESNSKTEVLNIESQD